MDREIPKTERRKAILRKWLRIGGAVIAIIIAIVLLTNMATGKVDLKTLDICTVDKGDLQVSVSASGSVVPEYQEIIVSPISTRIVETYKRTGDIVEKDEPLLRLDLQTVETDYRKGLDDEQIRRLQTDKLKANQNTQLTDLKMRIEVAQMALNSKAMELRNERYLDSIGSGTTDRVRQAQLDYNTARLELEQLRKQYENTRKAANAEYKVQQLDVEMFRKGLAEKKRTLDDAKIRSPRRAVLTYINNSIGAQIAQGEQIAMVSDLGSFKVECSIADGYTDRLAVGGRVLVRSGKKQLAGIISNLNPQAKNSMVEFTVRLDNPSDKLLRSGLKVEVYVLTSDKSDVIRIKNGPFYEGAGTYKLYVRDGDSMYLREVRLGEASYDYIEVLSGLKPGEQVVVSDMEHYDGKSKLRVL